MNESRSNDDAQPAKASSVKRRLWSGHVSPWIEERLNQEKRVRAQAEAMGVDPSLLLKPNSRKFRRSLDPVLDRFHDDVISRHDKPIPF
jgi:hypothetical protein